MKVVSESEFSRSIKHHLRTLGNVGCVTGPGRSGALAAVYASHFLRVPFIPFGINPPAHLGKLLVIDTATDSGATLRKAARRYISLNPLVTSVFHEPPRVQFWYEVAKRDAALVF